MPQTKKLVDDLKFFEQKSREFAARQKQFEKEKGQFSDEQRASILKMIEKWKHEIRN